MLSILIDAVTNPVWLPAIICLIVVLLDKLRIARAERRNPYRLPKYWRFGQTGGGGGGGAAGGGGGGGSCGGCGACGG